MSNIFDNSWIDEPEDEIDVEIFNLTMKIDQLAREIGICGIPYDEFFRNREYYINKIMSENLEPDDPLGLFEDKQEDLDLGNSFFLNSKFLGLKDEYPEGPYNSDRFCFKGEFDDEDDQ